VSEKSSKIMQIFGCFHGDTEVEAVAVQLLWELFLLKI
jgi:hypothetical protein